jgi:gamma-glutamyltranspeptidase / glutathione hydrolase
MARWKRSPGMFNFAVPHPRGEQMPHGLSRLGEALGVGALIRAFSFTVLLAAIVARPAPSAAVDARHEMVAAEGDLAARAGLGVLKHGGNAVDAAVATSLVLGVTNSGSCGIGGGGFMLIYWAKSHRLYGLDYRERAPMAANSAMYVRNGKADEELARNGPLAVAVPGELAGLDAALRRFGTMKFAALAAPAIKLARDGFPLTPHMADDIRLTASKISQDPGFRTVFFDDAGAPLTAGAIAYNRKLASLLEGFGNDPVADFYHGKAARHIVGYMKQRGGLLTLSDLADYRPVWRMPISIGYRGYQIYTMPPPSSGGVVLEILAMLESDPVGGLGVDSPLYLARLIQLMRQGFIDRANYADPAYVTVPLTRLLSAKHVAEAREIALHHAGGSGITVAHDHGTSNFCVVDREGNVVVVTTTINTIFGAKMMIPELGLILNDEMDDFTVAPGVPNAFKLVQADANEVAPGKRPLSSMSPVIVLKNGQPILAAGASGGPTIINGVVQVVLNELDFHLGPEQAVAEPRIHDQAAPDIVLVETNMPAKIDAALVQMGYQLKTVPELGAVNSIEIAPDNLRGAFDHRKGGGVAGD